MKKVKLGFYAVKFGSVALCHGASLVVTHDKSTLRELAPVNKGHVYQTVYLHHVLDGLALGAEYDFDTPAFNVLKEHIDLNEFTHHVLDEAEPAFHRTKLAV
ncbi:hypothetical protein M2H12_21630 [Vibrio vulnificus]|uniref:hypothetical protein n=1 Tax=Vibrio vulnificus TaxID=672 RepID=UPI0010295863|nr:hypothetical protein [Vibrio vulnificus]MCU8168293.1 hypothetical protein [Vibrio vulnificus]MCU8172840.1 hypothetical protein [Vibrio vulnificus]MCU8269048.1 hypothetical protein [Vibrio vulnificus]RZP95313.1 hypothetical protein D8T54_14150 [Vibrio vulnificus]RZR41755.1 hypothetical protein D8T58_20510 [Vibrio vulnificus]